MVLRYGGAVEKCISSPLHEQIYIYDLPQPRLTHLLKLLQRRLVGDEFGVRGGRIPRPHHRYGQLHEPLAGVGKVGVGEGNPGLEELVGGLVAHLLDLEGELSDELVAKEDVCVEHLDADHRLYVVLPAQLHLGESKKLIEGARRLPVFDCGLLPVVPRDRHANEGIAETGGVFPGDVA